MKNLKLLQRLQASEMVTLILQTSPGDVLDYFIIARTINYSIIANGKCAGSISAPMRTFNILLAGLMPMVGEGYDFSITYDNDVLKFISKDETVTLTPLCVEFHDEQAESILRKFQRYLAAADAEARLVANQDNLEQEIAALQHNYTGAKQLHLEAEMQSSNPFSEDTGSKKIDQKFVPQIAEKKRELEELQRTSRDLSPMDLKPFKTIALAAARANEIVNFCGDYAIMELKTSYVLQKTECKTMAVQGKLLYNLLQYNDGEGFYWFENSLMFVTGAKEQMIVFLEKYLPNTKVDSTIVTRGVVLEKYMLSMRGVLKITQLMKSKFPEMTLDMGAPLIILENDKGERIEIAFKVEDMDSLELRKAMKGKPSNVTTAKISIPSEVQSLLGMFRDKLTICVKQRKVLLSSGDLYLVFGR